MKNDWKNHVMKNMKLRAICALKNEEKKFIWQNDKFPSNLTLNLDFIKKNISEKIEVSTN